MLATPQLVWGPNAGGRSVTKVTAGLAAPAPALPQPPDAPPPVDGPLNGAFVYLGGWNWVADAVNTPERVRTLVRWLRNGLGMAPGGVLVVPWTCVKAFPTCTGDSGGYAWVGGGLLSQGGTPDVLFSVLDALFAEAKECGLSVVLGLAEQMMACSQLWTDPGIRDLAALMNETAVLTLGGRYDPAGWYLADESGACDPATVPFTRWQAQNIRAGEKAIGRAPLPIYASPYLGWSGHSRVPPPRLAAAVRAWKQQTGVDVVLFQDGVGACGANLGGLDEPTIKDYFAALGKLVWPNCETSCYAEHDANTGGEPGPASTVRYGAQIAQGAVVTGHGGVPWLPQTHLLPVAGSVPEAMRFCHEFRAWFGLGGRIHRPSAYEYMPGHFPLPAAFDDGNAKLHDLRTGTPFGADNHKDPAWVGVGNHWFTRHYFAAPVNVDFAAAHFLQNEAEDIELPHTYQLRALVNGVWTDFKDNATGLPAGRRLPAGKVGEYVMSNLAPLGWRGVTQLDVWGSRTGPKKRLYCSEITVTEAG
jgi:hypothetical protein